MYFSIESSDYKIINNVYTGVEDSERIIFILTPERTLKLLADNPGMNIDFFFFDEVYKIDEDFSKDEAIKLVFGEESVC